MGTSEVLQLPINEKLLIMEALWDDMRERSERFEISPGEKQLLDERHARAVSGEAEILDWDVAKQSL